MLDKLSEIGSIIIKDALSVFHGGDFLALLAGEEKRW